MRNIQELLRVTGQNETEAPMWSRESYMGRIDFREYERWALKADIPRIFLHGRQKVDEYGIHKRKTVEGYLKRYGVEYLRENPVIVCPVWIEETTAIVIVDGHNKTRYSGKFGIRDVPSWIFPPECLAEIYKEAGLEPSKKEALLDEFRAQIAEALDSFSRMTKMPEEKYPKALEGRLTAEEVVNRIKSFSLTAAR